MNSLGLELHGTSSSVDVLEWFFDQPEQALATMQKAPEALELALTFQSENLEHVDGAIINATAFAAALLDRDGHIIESTALFDETGLLEPFEDIALNPMIEAEGVVFRKALTKRGATLVAFTRMAELEGWAFPAEWSGKITHKNIIAILPHFQSKQSLEHACLALGLTVAETRIAVSIIKLGDIQTAAIDTGISYQRARALVSSALKRTSARNMPELVRKIADVSIGLTPQSASYEALLMDIWGLSARQVALASLITDGLTRDQAAAALGISASVAKKEMSAIFETFGVRNSMGLTLLMREHALASLLTRSSQSIREIADLRSEPLHFAYRDDGSRIAFSDYGPAGGVPVFYFHSSMTSRHPPKGILRELNTSGCRVIAIDRPGFGLTDPASDNQFETAAQDFEIVRKKLKLSASFAVARGGAQALLAIARNNPSALRGVVLINPDPRSVSSHARSGPLGAAKELYFRNPRIIASIARLLCSRLTRERLGHWLAKSLKGSPADEAAAANSAIIDDYWRAVRSLSTGRVSGYVAEQVAIASGVDEPLQVETWPWKILIGEQDTLHDAADVELYWRNVLPFASVERIADAGRMLAFTHPELVSKSILSLRNI